MSMVYKEWAIMDKDKKYSNYLNIFVPWGL